MKEISNETPIVMLTVKQLLEVIKSNEVFSEHVQYQIEIPDLFGTEQLKRITGYSLPTIYAKTSRNEIPHFKRGGRLFFKRSEITAWLTENPVRTYEEDSRKMDIAFAKRRSRV